MNDLLIITYDANDLDIYNNINLPFAFDNIKIISFYKTEKEHCKWKNVIINTVDNYSYEISQWKNVYFAPSLLILEDNYLKNLLLVTFQKKKKIFLSKEIELFCLQDSELSTEIVFYNNGFLNKETLEKANEKIFELRTPIVFVTGILEHMDKFSLFLAIVQGVKEKGLKVLAFGSKAEAQFWNLRSIPEYMFGGQIQEKDKIILFNHYIKKLEILEEPDLIIMCIPGEIGRYDNDAVGNLGVMLWLLKQIAPPDYLFCSIPFSHYSLQDLENLKKYIQNTAGVCCNSLHLSNKMINKVQTQRKGDMHFIRIRRSEIEKEIKKLLGQVCSVFTSAYKYGLRDVRKHV